MAQMQLKQALNVRNESDKRKEESQIHPSELDQLKKYFVSP